MTEPYASGLLDVGDGNQLYWEAYGNPDGIPSLHVHGGPGSGTSQGPRKVAADGRLNVIIFDQRNCGRSLPSAADPAVDLSANTTEHLVADMERLREHLGVDKWMLTGGSWGSTLILAYAQRHPDRVLAALIMAVTSTRPIEVDWLYQGVGRLFPAQWQAFLDAVPEAEAPPNQWSGDIRPVLRAYGMRLADPDPQVRRAAARAWLDWEDAVISQEVNGKPGQYNDRDDRPAQEFVRICAHYFSNDAFLPDGALLEGAAGLGHIPAVFVHGRFDLGSPVHTAYELQRAWPGSELVVVEDSGHTGSPAFAEAVADARDRLLARL